MRTDLEIVKEFNRLNLIDSDLSSRILDIVSELGEVAKELLKSTKYGKKPANLNEKIKEEIGDLYYSVLSLAAAFDLTLTPLLQATLQKYQKRIEETGTPGSI